MKQNVIEMFEKIKRINDAIDIANANSTLTRSFIIAYIILEYKLLNYLEIGTENNKSIFAAAYAAAKIDGMAYGVDIRGPKTYEAPSDSAPIATKQEESNYTRSGFSLPENSRLFQGISTVDYFSKSKMMVGLLHINDDNNSNYTLKEVNPLLSLVQSRGFIVLDNVYLNLVRQALNGLKKSFSVVFNNDTFAILHIETRKQKLSVSEISKLNILHGMVENFEKYRAPNIIVDPNKHQEPTISVIVISCNQEMYIAECLQGIYAQKGDFRIELILGDDASKDSTAEIIRDYIDHFGNDKIEVKIIASDHNVGMTRNFQRCLNACTGDFIAICEGDDYWIDCNKLQKQMDFLKLHPDCAICFNRIFLSFQESGKFSVFEPFSKPVGDIFTTKDLVTDHFIGNLSCCMYNAKYIDLIPENLFDLFIGDWMFNIYYSRFGNIGRLEDVMSVYRKHGAGSWAGKTPQESVRLLYDHINAYNKFMDFEYDQEFSLNQQSLIKSCPEAFTDLVWDIAVLDDVAPHPLSAFRVQEFISYLNEFEKIKIYSSGSAVRFLGSKTLEELIIDFKRKKTQYTEQIEILKPNTNITAKLIYMVFLGNAFQFIEGAENEKTPFVFTLYPGGMFGINNARSDKALRRVTSSPCFRKVIVTQRVTYDYLIEKNFCTPDQIEFIFGVVTPLEQLEGEYQAKKHFGIDKDTLDICFVAHKYTEKGVDKGYDVFVDVATMLSRKYPNIFFHVVGGFDESVLDVRHLKQKIKFYGSHEMEWFDEFYRDKDIILSANIPYKVYDGSFDGFPTGSCVDAGLRETAIFCTDELRLNSGFFIDREEIIIVPHNVAKIVDLIEYYYHAPAKLMMVAKNGRNKIKELYNYEAQILPRIKILREQIDLFESNKSAIEKEFKSVRFFRKRFFKFIPVALMKMRKAVPAWLKDGIKRYLPAALTKMRKVAPLWIKDGIKRYLPYFIRRIYDRFSE